MSREDLERAGLLLPRHEWGKRPLRTPVSRSWLTVIGGLAALSVGLMYWGDGGQATWIGVGLFLLALLGFTILSARAVDRQCRASSGERARRSE